MKAGRELDALIAEKVMGWIPWLDTRGEYTFIVWQTDDRPPWARSKDKSGERYTKITCEEIDRTHHIDTLENFFRPSTKIEHTWKVADKLASDGYPVTIKCDCIAWDVEVGSLHSGKIVRKDYRSGAHGTVPEQICLAALEAVE